MSATTNLLGALRRRSVRFVVIGVWGANLYAQDVSELFATRDKGLFLPPDPENLLEVWRVCAEAGLELLSAGGPLDRPRDLDLARAVVEHRALTRATDGQDLLFDLTLGMAGFDFETVWDQHRSFQLDDVVVPVARLAHIVRSKAAAGRPKDLLFLETHKEMLEDLERLEP